MPQSSRNRRTRRLTALSGALSLVAGLFVAGPARATSYDLRSVEYGGVSVEVPATWPVVDLAADPSACVRFDRPAVYLGEPAADQQCPAHAVGRADTVWIAAPEDSVRRAAQQPADPDRPPAGPVEVRTTRSPRGTATMEKVLRSIRGPKGVRVRSLDASAAGMPIRPDAATGRTQPAASRAAVRVPLSARTASHVTTAPAGTPSAMPTARPAASVNPTGGGLTGMAFDTCAAPSEAAMKAWRASPYAAIGIYLGGSMRACPDGNLSATWLANVAAQGWGFLPIWVGPQAPCVVQPNLTLIPTGGAPARALAVQNAGDAAARAQALGLPKGSVIHYDMEGYRTNDTACTAAVIAFLDAWSAELNRLGYASGVYGGASSVVRDLHDEVSSGRSFSAPQQIWIAHWDYEQTASDTNVPQYVPDSSWASQRARQYWGDHTETWGGVKLHVDSNWVEAPIPGSPTQQTYGAQVVGPGAKGFRFGGDMRYWPADASLGQRKLAHSTGLSKDGTEQNSATWRHQLARGTYVVEAYVPKAVAAGIARYTLTTGGDTRVVTIDQSVGVGWRSLGQVQLAAAGSATVRLGDNGSTSRTTRIWADAVRWRTIASAPLGAMPAGPWERIAGKDRYETSARISAAGFATATEAFVASGLDHADALSAGSVAGQHQAPLLLTRPGALPGPVRSELARLRPKRTYIVGGTGAVGESVAKEIAAVTGGTVERLSGPNRYATSARIAERLAPSATTVYVASGLGFADGAAGGAAAAREKAPVLLTGAAALPQPMTAYLARVQPTKVVILGGTGAVPDSAKTQLSSLLPGATIVRHAGADRYETAALAATALWTGAQWPSTVYVTGLSFPDALSATPLAVLRGGPVLLTTASCQPAATHQATTALRPGLRTAIGSSSITAAGDRRC